MRHKQETNSDHFARWPQQSSTWPRCCRPNRPPRLAPVSTVCLPRVDTCIHILPSYLAATQVTLEIQTRHASDVFKVDSVADVTLLHVQFSYQDILNVLSTNLTPLSHLIIKIKILFGMVHLYRFLKCERAIATMLHIARLRQTWFPCLIQKILTSEYVRFVIYPRYPRTRGPTPRGTARAGSSLRVPPRPPPTTR